MNLQVGCMFAALALAGLPAAAAEPKTTCSPVVFEYVNETKEPVHLMAFYRADFKGRQSTRSLRRGEPIPPGLAVRVPAAECIPTGATVLHSAEVIGAGEVADRTFKATGKPAECRVIVRSTKAGGVAHECRATKP